MKKCFFLSILFIMTATTFLCEAVKSDVLLGGKVEEPKLVVNNRILAKVNSKVISVIDLMKKMDMLFYKQFPQFATSIPARYQYYLANWKNVLTEMIDKELILADSEEVKLSVSAGDVREEMETLFGPNIIVNLDKIGLTYNEANKMVLDDIIMKRMLYFRVQSKALAKVTPQTIRNFYAEIAQKNIRDNVWVYNVVTIRHKDGAKAAETANYVYQLLSQDKLPLADLTEKFKDQEDKNSKVSVSEEFQTNEKELSETYMKTLITLAPESYSTPIMQKSRSDKSSVVRIFYLKKVIPGGAIPFSELADKIKEKLLDDEMDKESESYLKRLRQQYHVQDEDVEALLKEGFVPFELHQS